MFSAELQIWVWLTFLIAKRKLFFEESEPSLRRRLSSKLGGGTLATQNTLGTTYQCTKNHLEPLINHIEVRCNHPQQYSIVVVALRASIFFTKIYNMTGLFWPPQVIRKGEVSCCWTCTPCKENEFVFDEYTCRACELGSWPTDDLTGDSTSTFRAKCSSCS